MSRLPRVCALAIVGVVIGSAATASAQPPPPPPPSSIPEKPLPKVAIAISPIHLIFPIVEVTGEFRVQPKVGVAAILGAGSVEITNSDTRVSIFEIGASGRYYALGDFRHGMQLGAEMMWVGASADDGQTTATATGLALGAFVGYKWTASFGLTFDIQGGVQTYAFRAESSAGDTDEDSAVGPLLNLNIGWSF